MRVRFALFAAAAALALPPMIIAAQTPAPTAVKGFVVDQNGNLGVGTSAPAATLHVAGDSMTSGTIRGGGLNGQVGNAAVLNGFDSRYLNRKFLFRYDETGNPQTSIRIQAVNPSDPTRSVFKTFVIDHPRDPHKYLVHASLEGPEGAVFYRGSARLKNGRAVVRLPNYFEYLARLDGRTVQLTNVDGFDSLAVLRRGGRTVADGTFTVISDSARSSQRFDWEVKAVRADGPALQIEPERSAVAVAGFGPYTFTADRPYGPERP